MDNWNRLFIRHGFMVKEEGPNLWNCQKETNENMEFLLESLEKLSISYDLDLGVVTTHSPAVTEGQWIDCLDYQNRGRGEGLWFRPGVEEPKVRELDMYIVGMVRQFNRLGLTTMYCCDGHDRQRPTIGFTQWVDMDQVNDVLLATGVSRFRIREQRLLLEMKREQLLDATEKLAMIQ